MWSCVYYFCCRNTSRKWAQIFQCYFITNLWFSSAILSYSICVALTRLVVFFYCAVLSFSSLLFFVRTRAVFNTTPWVVAFFAGSWLGVLGGCIAFFIHTFKMNPAPTNSNAVCLNPGIAPYVAATTITPLINDTLVFLAISWRLSCYSYDPYTLERGFRFLIFGDYLPVFSKVLLQDGQAYYLLAIFPLILCLMLFI